MKTYNFKYGHGSVSLSLNEADILAELHGTETPPISDIRSALFASLVSPSTARLCASGSAPEIGWRW